MGTLFAGKYRTRCSAAIACRMTFIITNGFQNSFGVRRIGRLLASQLDLLVDIKILQMSIQYLHVGIAAAKTIIHWIEWFVVKKVKVQVAYFVRINLNAILYVKTTDFCVCKSPRLIVKANKKILINILVSSGSR